MNARIYILGSGAAIPIHRSPPCIAIKVDSDIYVLDPGEACQIRMLKTGLSPLKARSIFISHLHGDHYLGLPGMIQTMTLSNRKDPLYIVAPKEFKDFIEISMEKGFIKPGFKLELFELYPGFTYEDGKIIVKAFQVLHSIESYGFHIAIGKKTICYTGDTRPTDVVIENCREADILIHEATFTSAMHEEAYEQGHSTALDAALIALRANVKMLVLTHISARYNDDEILKDAKRFFKNCVVARDGMVLIL
ncbi:MAG: ribonuclease Z [Desulfurococcaceae archaeon]